MIERLEVILAKYEELSKELLREDVLSDFSKTAKLSKEQKDLEETVNTYKEYKKVVDDLFSLKEMEKDPEMVSIVKDEISVLEEEQEKLNQKLEFLLIPKDENDGKNVIMEIRGAAGGDEANIFAGDLFRMYSHYAEKNNWKIEIMNAVEGTSGGFSQIELMISGENVYSKLKYESGAHRVQRVPETESQGRVHTSTATVVVLPEVEAKEITLNENDLKIDVYHSSGAGGQSVNTSNSAVRITHLPTNTVVTYQTERSQLKNKQKALQVLAAKLQDEERRKEEQKIGSERKSKIGTGDRSEKIRTYNYPQNRITDHRINFSIMELDKVMNGNLEPIIEALILEDQKRKLAQVD